MARCGCGSSLCNCTVTAGEGVTVTGSGTIANPYIVSTGTVPCSVVRPCISAGNGASYDSATGVITARLSGDANNPVVFGTDGGLYATVPCSQVRPCISATNGAAYNPATGVITADLSTDAGNNIVLGTDSGLYVPTGAATVSVACGLTGDGSAGNPLTVNAPTAWGFPCAIATNGSDVVCDTTTGQLKGEPPYTPQYVQFVESRNYANPLVPAVTTTVDTFAYTITNNDPCRAAMIHVSTELDVDFNLPANSGAAMSLGEELWYTANTGATAITDTHNQIGRTRNQTLSLAPGASLNVTVDPQLGRGSGGATYNRIQVNERFMFHPIG
ncbi:hypothetical protein ABZ543_07995 [Streptomyces roseifaciens]